MGLGPVPDIRPLLLYPSPCADRVHLDAAADLAGTALEVLDATGRTVLTRTLRTGENTIDVSGLAPGLYTGAATTRGARLVGRLVKE